LVLQVIRRAALYRVPLYVTETGVSIASEQQRCYAVDAYMKEVRRDVGLQVVLRMGSKGGGGRVWLPVEGCARACLACLATGWGSRQSARAAAL
jgi:hypothetical protein